VNLGFLDRRRIDNDIKIITVVIIIKMVSIIIYNLFCFVSEPLFWKLSLKAEKCNLNSNSRETFKSRFLHLPEHKHGLIGSTQGNVGATNWEHSSRRVDR
jgi:hypothetical protein